MASAGDIAKGAASGAAMGTAVLPGWGTAIGAVGGGLYSAFAGGDDDAAQAPPAQYGAGNGSALTNHLAALDYSEGLSQQQAQNAREAAFYNAANGNFDIANAAQFRDAPGQVADVTRTGQRLEDLGTRPMGASYAEAQLQQGQQAAMAQQLSMAHSGRSLGSGQAAMNNAAFNNAALNQQTNQAAASARIQEQNAYNEFQKNALGAAGQQYNAAGGMVQNQGQINNQTSGMYNDLGAKQQGFGLTADQLGQNAYQYGASAGAAKQQGQLNANVGQTSSTTATNLANASRADANNAGTLNALSTAAGVAATNLGDGGAAPVNANNPSGSTSPYKGITDSSHSTDGPVSSGSSALSATSAPTAAPGVVGQAANAPSTQAASNIAGLAPTRNPNEYRSDESKKKNVVPLSPSGSPLISGRGTDPAAYDKYASFSPEDAAFYKAADEASKNGTAPKGPLMDNDTNKVAVTDEPTPGPDVATYGTTINHLNNVYRASQMAPADVLNHKGGAGASNSQAALIEKMLGRSPSSSGYSGSVPDLARGVETARMPTAGPKIDAAAHAAISARLGSKPGQPMAPTAPSAAPARPGFTPEQYDPNWGDVFNAPTLDPRAQRYLEGYDPQPATPAPAPYVPQNYGGGGGYDNSDQGYLEGRAAPNSAIMNRLPGERSSDVTGKTEIRGLDGGASRLPAPPVGSLSDAASKTRIAELEGQLAALGGAARVTPRAPDTAALDASEYGRQVHPGVDFRNAHGYSYEYKDPHAPGAAPGRQVGTMAQELENTSAAPYVRDTKGGKMVDTGRLPLALAPAIGETQRRVDDLESQLDALKGSGLAGYGPRSKSWFTPQQAL